MPDEIKDAGLNQRADVIVSDSKDASVFLAKEIVGGVEVATAIQPQKEAVAPNAVFIPQVVIQTSIINGVLKSSIQIIVSSANLNNGMWTNTGVSETVYLNDISNLDTDIAHLSKELGTVYSNIVAAVAEINKIRQVI